MRHDIDRPTAAGSDDHMNVNMTTVRPSWTLVVTFAFVGLLPPTAVIAQTSRDAVTAASLSARVLALKDEYQGVSPKQITASKATLQDNLAELDRFLDDGGVLEGWRTYLHWDALDEQLAAEEPDLDELREVLARLSSNVPGLEQTRFRAVTTTLEQHISLLTIASLPNADEYHAQRMESLAEALDDFDAAPDAAKRRTIAGSLAWLRQSGQAPDLISDVQKKFSQANLHVEASARFVSAGLTQPVEYTDPIRDRILGASISGQGHTRGTMRGELLANPNCAAMQLNVTGRTDASTVARKRHVTVWGDGVTTFTAHKVLAFDEQGFSAGIAKSCATSNNRVRCISAPPIIKQLARMQLEHQKEEGNRIAAQHAVPMINQRVDQEAEAIVDSANAAYRDEFRDPLLRVNAFPQQIQLRTTPGQLAVTILQATDDQLAAPLPPAMSPLAHDISLQMHETAVENMAESLLAGRTVTDEQLRADISKYLTMASLEQYAPAAEDEPWSVTLSSQRPVTVDFQDDTYTLTIAGERWSSGRRSFRALNASVTYRIESDVAQVRLVRDDEILIAPPGFVRGQGRLSPLVISARRVLQRKLDELLPAVINPENLIVPGPWEQAGPLRVVSMTADSGWLEASWEMSPSEPNAADGRTVLGQSKD